MQRPIRSRNQSPAPERRQSVLVRRSHRSIPQLTHVPIGVRQGQANHGDILPDTTHLLSPPERERIVVPVGEEDPVRGHRVQEIVSEIGCQPSIGPVPPGGRTPVEDQRQIDTSERTNEQRRSRGAACRSPSGEQTPGKHNQPHSSPDAPDNEAHDKEVVSLTNLVSVPGGVAIEPAGEPRLEVHVDDQAESGDQEKEEQQPPGGAVGSALRQGTPHPQ